MSHFLASFVITFLLLVVSIFASSIYAQERIDTPANLKLQVNKLYGKFSCVGCVIAVTILENEIKDHEGDIKSVLMRLCDQLPKSSQAICKTIVELEGKKIIEMLLKKESPSKICNTIHSFSCNNCTIDTPKQWNEYLALPREQKKKQAAARIASLAILAKQAWTKHMATNAPASNGDNLVPSPAFDHDGDYSATSHLIVRGANWRGGDCNDNDANVRPGVYEDPKNPNVDKNCNGIFGYNETAGKSNEELYCSQTPARQIYMFGDSASSGFHIPAEWFRLANLSKLISAFDEADYPQLSWSTGFDETINGQSIYGKMRERNLCNHRAYTNVGHNGHRSEHFASVQIPAIRFSADMTPVLGFVAYIGNDVCSSHHLTPEEFTANIVRGLTTLDASVPPNSKIMLMGLVDGRILYNTMAKKTHPLGCDYDTLYRFLICTQTDVCNSWLTPNATDRDAASALAKAYSDALRNFVDNQQGKFKNLELAYVDFPMEYMVDAVTKMGLDPAVLIEVVDGFHPSHYAHNLVTQYVWTILETKYPHWIGPVNPFNAEIRKRFGDQGGY